MLRSYAKDSQWTWDQNISQIGFALRTAVNETTDFTSSYLNFGRELWAKKRNYPQAEPNLQSPSSEDIGQRGKKIQSLRDIFEDVKLRLQEAYKANEKQYNLQHCQVEFKEGAKVLKRSFLQLVGARFF